MMMKPLEELTTPEVLKRYGMGRATLDRRRQNRRFPSPTGKRDGKRSWSVKVLEEYEAMLEEKSRKSYVRVGAYI